MLRTTFLLALGFLTLCGCHGKRAQIEILHPQASVGAGLRMSRDSWVGYAPWTLGASHGLFEKEGVTVQLKLFTEMADSRRAFENHQVDVALLTLNEVLLMKDRGLDPIVILAIDFSAGSDGVVAKPQVKNLKALKGKRVGVEVGTISHYTLLKALEKASLKETDVTLVNLGSQDMPKAFKSGKIDALSLWEPFLTNILKESGGNRIFSSREIPGAIIDVMVVHKKVLSSRRADLVKLCRVWWSILDLMQHRREEAIREIARVQGDSAAVYAQELAGVELTGREPNQKLMGSQGKLGTIANSLREVASFLRKQGLISREYEVESLVANDLYREAL